MRGFLALHDEEVSSDAAGGARHSRRPKALPLWQPSEAWSRRASVSRGSRPATNSCSRPVAYWAPSLRPRVHYSSLKAIFGDTPHSPSHRPGIDRSLDRNRRTAVPRTTFVRADRAEACDSRCDWPPQARGKSFWPYSCAGGFVHGCCSGVAATRSCALVPLVPFLLRHAARDPGFWPSRRRRYPTASINSNERDVPGTRRWCFLRARQCAFVVPLWNGHLVRCR